MKLENFHIMKLLLLKVKNILDVLEIYEHIKFDCLDVTPTRIMLGLRSSPRKRLLLSEANDLPHLSPSEKIRKVCAYTYLLLMEKLTTVLKHES